MSFSLTLEQQAAIQLACNKDIPRVKIIAYAGAGKTSTIAEIAKVLYGRNYRGLYVAFNKKIVEDARRKLQNTVDVSTFHGLAYRAVGSEITDKLKTGEKLFPQEFFRWFEGEIIQNARLTGYPKESYKGYLADKAKGLNATIPEMVERKIDDDKLLFKIIKGSFELFLHSVDLELTCELVKKKIAEVINDIVIDDETLNVVSDALLPLVNALWEDATSPVGEAHFSISHDVYLKMYQVSNPILGYDYILFDESQDTDPLMLDVLSKQKCRICFVGDPYQQIYSFRGAVDAMEKFEGHETYLSQSFRFGEQIADVANIFLQRLEAPKPLLGNTKIVSKTTLSTPKGEFNYLVPNAVLCSTNAGCIEQTLTLHDKYPRKRIQLDFSGDVKEVIELIKTINIFSRNPNANRGHPILKNFETYDSLCNFCDEFPNEETIGIYFQLYKKYGEQKIIYILENFTKVNRPDIVVTTAHKSKGREWDTVYIHHDFVQTLIYSRETVIEGKKRVIERLTDTPEKLRLAYVAFTRAKKNLIINPTLNDHLIREIKRLNLGVITVESDDEMEELMDDDFPFYQDSRINIDDDDLPW